MGKEKGVKPVPGSEAYGQPELPSDMQSVSAGGRTDDDLRFLLQPMTKILIHGIMTITATVTPTTTMIISMTMMILKTRTKTCSISLSVGHGQNLK
ncbi:MAG: hypothetical protein IPL01_23750 [Acidobacteria bacterium]|nr:hypothetical protein [Acidobacteriota bacterium]